MKTRREADVLRFPLQPHREVSQRTGRKFCRLAKGDEVVSVVLPLPDQPFAALASSGGRVIAFPVEQVNILSGPGKGVRGIKLQPRDRVVTLALSTGYGDPVQLLTASGSVRELPVTDNSVTSRGGKGRHLVRRDTVVGAAPREIEIPTLTTDDGGEDDDTAGEEE